MHILRIVYRRFVTFIKVRFARSRLAGDKQSAARFFHHSEGLLETVIEVELRHELNRRRRKNDGSNVAVLAIQLERCFGVGAAPAAQILLEETAY
jgi:hypothetical protein